MMNLNESVAKLQTLLPKLKANDAKFASDLVASYKRYKNLTPKQAPWVEKLIARAENPAPVFSAPLAAPAGVHVGGFAGVVALLTKAKEHLKFPKVRLTVNGTLVILSLNGKNSKRPGHVSISGEGVYPNRMFYGSVSPEGVFTPFKSELPGLTGLLTELAKNPARVAKEHGKLTGNCAFCGKVLGLGEDKRSVMVGFGPVCADHYGLKAEWLAAAEKVGTVMPTQKVEALNVLAEELEKQKELDALAAEVEAMYNTDEEAKDTLAKLETLPPMSVDDEAVESLLGKMLSTCLFCEKPSADVKVLNGHTVCSECVKTLTAE